MLNPFQHKDSLHNEIRLRSKSLFFQKKNPHFWGCFPKWKISEKNEILMF